MEAFADEQPSLVLLVQRTSEANAGERSCSKIAKQLSAVEVRTVRHAFQSSSIWESD